MNDGTQPNERTTSGTTRCIYCGDELTESKGNSKSRSKEHIIPEAVGGRAPLITHDCCRICNSNLGSEIDAPLVKNWLVAAERYRLGLRGKKGANPTFSFPHSDECHIPGVSVFEKGKIRINITPNVSKTPQADGSTFLEVSGAEDDVTRIVSGMLRKQEREKGKHITEQDLNERVKNLLSRSPKKSIREIKSEFQYEGLPILKGLAKIALGTGHVFFGDDWTFSSASDVVRNVIQSRSFDHARDSVGSFMIRRLRTDLVGVDIWPENAHMVSFQHANGGAVITASLFGNDALNASFFTEHIPPAVQEIYPFGRMLIAPLSRDDSPTWYDVLDWRAYRKALPDDIMQYAKSLRKD